MEKEHKPAYDWATLREISVAIVGLNQVKNPNFNPHQYSKQDLIAYAKNLSTKLYGGEDVFFAIALNRTLGGRGTLLATALASPDTLANEIVKVMLGESAYVDRTILTFVRNFISDKAKLLHVNNS